MNTNPTGSTICLVSCVGQKAERRCRAEDLYLSDWFVKARSYAEAAGYRWFILSAQYGLVAPDCEIDPYEMTLNNMPIIERREWAARVCGQLVNAVPDMTRAVFLAGAKYREFLVDPLIQRNVEVSIPMEGLRIGEQLSWFNQNTQA